MGGRESVVRTSVLDHGFFTIGRCPGDRVVGSGELNMSVRRQGGRDSIVGSEHTQHGASTRQGEFVVAACDLDAATCAIQSRRLVRGCERALGV
jgi:hypothetical protein